MSRIKTFTCAILLLTPVLFSSNSFAFDIPKEFSSFDLPSYSEPALFTPELSSIKPGQSGRAEAIKTALLVQYSNWKGTQYHWGGTTHAGVDCSSLMQQIFNDSMHKQLPRTTFQQIKNGEKVRKENLKPGDLVFFKTEPDIRHVGVYIGDHQFIHASKSHGVTISSLDDQYWINHYETARRLELMS
ncbi:C40 family peptidase [Ewingella americana]